MSKIAILGAGRVATNLAAKLAAAGHAVTLGVRDTAKPRAVSNGPELTLLPLMEAASGANVIINAMPGDVSLHVLSDLREALAGKVLLDVSNATSRSAEGHPAGLMFADGSLGERLQLALPQTEVVKSLNTMLFTVMTAPQTLGTPPTAFVSGDSLDAKTIVRNILQDLGWKDEWIEDLGGISSAQGTEAMMLLVPFILKARGFVPFGFAIAR